MGANQSAAAEVGEPKAVVHDMDSDQWTEEFSKEYNRLRSTDAELSTPAEPSDALDDAERECERERPGPPRVPLQEMMVKESLSEIQSMLGPVIGREIISEGAGAENRFSYTFDGAGDDHRGHRGGDEYETSHGMRKRPRLGSPQHHGMVGASGDPRDVPVEHAYTAGFSGGHEGGAGYEGRVQSSGAPQAYEWRGHGKRGQGRGDGGAVDDAELSYYGADPVQRQNVNELNATMEAALSALYDNTGMGGSSLLGTPQFTGNSHPDSMERAQAMAPLQLTHPAVQRGPPLQQAVPLLGDGDGGEGSYPGYLDNGQEGQHEGHRQGPRVAHGYFGCGDGGGGAGSYAQDDMYGFDGRGEGFDPIPRYEGDEQYSDEDMFSHPPGMFTARGERGGPRRGPGRATPEQRGDAQGGSYSGGGDGGDDKGRSVWTHAEDTIILEGVAQMGFKWRRIAAMLPNRSDDAVRNRWHRLEEARRHNDATGVANDAGYERSSVYKCSRCGQPKKHHICLAPEETSRSEEIKAKKSAGKDTQRLTWSREEDEIILQSVEEFGPKWLEIATRLPGRTDHAARNRYHRLQRCHRPADALAAGGGVPETLLNGVADTLSGEGGRGSDGGGGSSGDGGGAGWGAPEYDEPGPEAQRMQDAMQNMPIQI